MVDSLTIRISESGHSAHAGDEKADESGAVLATRPDPIKMKRT